MRVIDNTQAHANGVIQIAKDYPNAHFVFDIDGVLLSAAHRINWKACPAGGAPIFDLEQYRKDTTAEKVAQDKSLPLLDVVHALNFLGREYSVCTARVYCEHTQILLANRGIRPIHVMSRDGDNDTRRDSELKHTKLMATFTPNQLRGAILIDDVVSNCEVALSLGMGAIHVDKTEGGHIMQTTAQELNKC